jgi:voltage-gated potassium channel
VAEPALAGRAGLSLRDRAFRILEGDAGSGGASRAGRLATAAVVGTVVVGCIAAMLETEPAFAAVHRGSLAAIIDLCVALFVVEYLIRLWVAPERVHGRTIGDWQIRYRYAISPTGLIDLLAILPTVLFALGHIDNAWLRALQLLWLLKLMRYASALTLVVTVIRNESRSLLAALSVMIIVMTMAAGVMFALEHEAQPTVFGSVPQTLWWAIVTMGTVGYGDMVPVTPGGKLFASVVMVIGIAMFAVPAGIMATGFAAEIRKRDFVVTWQLVAKVPLFQGLDAARIAEITRLLQPEVVPENFVIVRRGEPAEAMFFIVEGTVEVDVPPTPIRLARGQFFGEIALLRDTVRTATVTAVEECQLLSLDIADFRHMLDAHPDLRATLQRVAEERRPGLGQATTPEA